MAVGTLVFGRSSYQNVVCLGLVVNETGRKMSKHLGNVLEPMPLMEAHGADAVRWFFAAAGSPWSTRRIGASALDEIVRKVLLTYWNTVSFLVLYANAAAAQGQGWGPADLADAPAPATRPLLDRWLLSELHAVTADVTDALDGFDTAAAGRRLAGFIDDMSNWYVRRSRRRFWEGTATPDSMAAFATLYECLETLTRLMAPIAAFLTDYVWGVLRPTGGPDSVHLAVWPQADHALIDRQLSAQMALTRRLVELGRSARAAASVQTRQPLPRALVAAPGFADLPPELRAEIAQELNVRSLDTLTTVADDLVDHVVKPNFRALGRRFGKTRPQAVASALTAADPAAVRRPCTRPENFLSPSDGAPVVHRAGRGHRDPDAAGQAGPSPPMRGETVALEVAITPELRREGLAREVIRQVQDARKSDGLHVSDRIQFWWQAADPELAAALTEHAPLVASEVLAVEFGAGRPGEPDEPQPDEAGRAAGATIGEHTDVDLGLTFWLRRA